MGSSKYTFKRCYMGWKELPYWLKGVVIIFSLIAAYIIIVGLFLGIISKGKCTPCEAMTGVLCEQYFIDCFDESSMIFYAPITIPSPISAPFSGMNVGIYFPIMYSLLWWIIIGVLIGWIYGKIKKR